MSIFSKAVGSGIGFLSGAMKHGGAMGTAMKGGIAGGIAGGAYGAVSNDTSVLGGALAGASIGGLGGYGVARAGAIRGTLRASGGAKQFGNEMLSMVRHDAGRFGKTARKGYNAFRALGRG